MTIRALASSSLTPLHPVRPCSCGGLEPTPPRGLCHAGRTAVLLHPAWHASIGMTTRSHNPVAMPAISRTGMNLRPLARGSSFSHERGRHALHCWHRRHEGGSAHASGQVSYRCVGTHPGPAFRVCHHTARTRVDPCAWSGGVAQSTASLRSCLAWQSRRRHSSADPWSANMGGGQQ
jgi:hypothetical protein